MVIFTSHYSVLVEFIHSLKYLYFFYVIKLKILSICHIQWNRLFVQHVIYFNAITHTKLIGRSYCAAGTSYYYYFLFGRFFLMCGFFISNSICDTRLTFTPFLVFQVRPSLLASTAAVTVVPLLPPQPTSITPSRGTRRSVRIVISVVRGVTCDGQSAG